MRFIIPDGSILRPSDTAAVVGGNVLTCQRVVDVRWRLVKAMSPDICVVIPQAVFVMTQASSCPHPQVILKAFGAAAGSQGCMNNFTFGNSRMGYYETIAGGGLRSRALERGGELYQRIPPLL